MSTDVEKLVEAIKCAAEISIRNDAKWCEVLCATFPDVLSEISEGIRISAVASLSTICDEIVRVNLHFDNPINSAPVCDALRMAITPLTIEGRQLAAHDTAEGFIICLQDIGQKEIIHDDYATLETARPGT